MLQNWISALIDGALYLIAWWAPVAYVAGAGFITHVVAGDNERARNWMIGLFLTVFILLVVLVSGWPSALDDAS